MSLKTLSLTIPAGHSMSGGVDCSGSTRILRIIMPPDWDAAALTFQTSVDGVVYNNLHLAAPVGDFTTYPATIPVVTPGAAITMPPNTGYGISWLRFRSGTFTVQTKQSADRTFSVVLEMPDAATGGGGTGTGPAGPTGPAGTAGPVGAAGPTGATGPVGPVGMSGAIGTQGATGAAGSAGPVGPQGPTGLAGGTGLQGAQGIQGSPGVQGALGPTGPTGTFNLKGVTDGSDAAVGNIGEVMATGNSAGIALTTGVTANVASLALTAGDWTVSGLTIFTPAGSQPTSLAAGINVTSGALPTATQITSGVGALTQYRASFANAQIQNMPAGVCRVSVNVPTTVYLVAQGSFAGGTLNVAGYISARRIR